MNKLSMRQGRKDKMILELCQVDPEEKNIGTYILDTVVSGPVTLNFLATIQNLTRPDRSPATTSLPNR